jgi:Xaa-Pro aminopeptidase
MDSLSNAIRKSGADAYVIYASSRDTDMKYLTHFTTSDPFVFFKKPGEPGVIIISQMEAGRASREATSTVMTRTQAGLPEIMKTEKDPYHATAKMIAGQVGKKILVPPNFPIALANAMSEYCSVVVDSGTIQSMRAKKSKIELILMKKVQKVTERAMDRAISLIRSSSVKKGILYIDQKPLTSEQV